MRYPKYTSKKHYRENPELLEPVNSVKLVKDVNQRIWIKINVSGDTPAGVYTGVVNIYETGSSKVIKLPIQFKVFNYKLKKDPNKHYSAYLYNSSRQFKGRYGADLDKARTNELKSMLSYGIDMFPTVYVKYDRNADKLVIDNKALVEEMIRLGFKGQIPIVEGMKGIYERYYPHSKYGYPGKHWVVPVIPPVGHPIYAKIRELYKNLDDEMKALGWPEAIYSPMDEVYPQTSEFAKRVFATLKSAGLKTWINQNPNGTDSITYHNDNSITAWCSKTFAYPYSKVVSDTTHEYWSYPNHNTGEIKDLSIMQKGGRMTFGLGFWRSGYKTILPWHWHWIPLSGKEFDYLKGFISGTGVRMDEHENIIPTVYWENFREGVDDLRYIYTLETAIVQHDGTSNVACKKLIQKGKNLLQNIWNQISPDEAYYDYNAWSDKKLQELRLQIATLTEKIEQFPKTNNKLAPTVIVNPNLGLTRTSMVDYIDQQIAKGNVRSYSLQTGGKSGWRSKEKEAKLVISNEGNLKLIVDVDFKHNANGGTTGSVINWPTMYRYFGRNQIDLLSYDYLYLKVKLSSNRSPKSINFETPVLVNFLDYSGSYYDFKTNFGTQEDKWLTVAIPMSVLAKKSRTSNWHNLKLIKFAVAERFYTDKTHLEFEIKDLQLLKILKH